ncbi:transcriptional regulator GcvA [Vibrio celticus]|uniref:Glycine cleavage system transcriptional activator n=1 Tax=Vibrio celticus TaxID=446372 RepID=A0A1C3JGB1_9VIBR|nr:transcriptional regulator GcvA [Vibrio celticus]SBT14074.1 Glycine cleavage system transcriptional activator [Vibrio celticus]
MALRLPPLEALRYFEAAARHLSFTLAAQELCVSQSAVSQKVIQLEQRLNFKLFERKPRQLTLTINGEHLYLSVQLALLQIRDTLSDIDSKDQMTRLEVYCMPSFASRWLMPCLSSFYQNNPKIDLLISASFSEPNFRNEDVDIGICHGVGDQPSMEQTLLFRDYIYPVASPSLLAKLPLRTPEDLRKTVLLHDSLPQAKLSTSWQRWFSDLGVSRVDCNAGYSFNQADLIVQAAIDGQGVALGRHSLVARDVAAGKLVPLFGHALEDDGVYLVCLKKLTSRPQIQRFSHWMRQQAKEFETRYSVDSILSYKHR